MFTVLQLDINSLKSGLLHLTSQPYCKKSKSDKVKDGIINLILRNYLIAQYTICCSAQGVIASSSTVKVTGIITNIFPIQIMFKF